LYEFIIIILPTGYTRVYKKGPTNFI